MDHDDMQSWTSLEDDRLREALILNKKGTKNWREVAAHVGTKTAHQCQQRWKNTLNPDVLRIKGRWTTEEDTRLAELVKRHGTKNWRYIASHLRGRLPKQCRERWCNQLDPHIKKDGLTGEEWITVKRAHEIYGNRWAEIAKQVPGRTANHIKNQWNTMLRRASADAESDGSISDEVSDGENSSSTTMTSNSRKRKSGHSLEDELAFFDTHTHKRSKYTEDDDSSLSESEPMPVDLDEKQMIMRSASAPAAPSPSFSPKSAGDFSAFSALVEASCEVLQQQAPPSPSKLPTLLHLLHPSLYMPLAGALSYNPVHAQLQGAQLLPPAQLGFMGSAY